MKLGVARLARTRGSGRHAGWRLSGRGLADASLAGLALVCWSGVAAAQADPTNPRRDPQAAAEAPQDAGATAAMDRALLAIATAN